MKTFKDYMEIMDFCGYDLTRANAIAKGYETAVEEEMRRVGLEAIQSESMPQERRGLCGEGDFCRPGADVV